MVVLKKWNTLTEASEWLSSKTNGRWSPARIINFAIKQCREDDAVEGYKYPTYLRATFSKVAFPDVAFVELHLNDNQRFCIYDEIQLNEIEITITPVFRENLIALSAGKKTSMHYVSCDHQSKVVTFDQADPLIVFAELNQPFIIEGILYPKFPQIPIIHINYESLGIRDAELKELLRDYLALSKKSQKIIFEDAAQQEIKPGSDTEKSTELNQNELNEAAFQAIARLKFEKNSDITYDEIINSLEVDPRFRNKYERSTLITWARKVNPNPANKRGGRPQKKHQSLQKKRQSNSLNKTKPNHWETSFGVTEKT